MTDITARAAPSLRAIARGWRQWRRRMRARAELAALGSDAGPVARDLNSSGAEFAHLSELPSTSADLLNERMASLGLSPSAVGQHNLAVMRDLQRACSSCSLKSRCTRDLASAREAAVAEYCPNEQTLEALRQAGSKTLVIRSSRADNH